MDGKQYPTREGRREGRKGYKDSSSFILTENMMQMLENETMDKTQVEQCVKMDLD